MNVVETTYFLQMESPDGLRASPLPAIDVALMRVEVPSPWLNRALYAKVGAGWWWIDRLGWSEEQWGVHLGRAGCETWIALNRGTPVGYFELAPGAGGDAKIDYFGVLPDFLGKGVGGWMLTACTKRAWEISKRRVVVNTSSLDHPAALANYKARGFVLVREDRAEKALAAEAPNWWGGSEGVGSVLTEGFTESFLANKLLADRAIAQVDDAGLNQAIDAASNSIAVIMAHLAGNFRSRWTDFLTTDGEKPDRDRDREFDASPRNRASILADWESGWNSVVTGVRGLTGPDFERTVRIRGELHSVPLAIARSLSHAGYHVGQIVTIARTLVGDRWQTLTIPRGGTAGFNQKMFDEARGR